MNQPLISVIVPAYNAEQWLEDCCRSVFEQTWTNWELVIVDDGSRDGTLELAQKLAEGRANVNVIHTENGGVSHARNLALDNARGDYITFLDADDLLFSDALETLNEIRERTGADVVIAQNDSATMDGIVTRNVYPEAEEIWRDLDGVSKALEDHPATYFVGGKLYARDVLNDLRFVTERRISEDNFFLFQCLMRRPIVAVVDRVVIRYRMTNNSATRGVFSEKVFAIAAFCDEKIELIQVECPELMGLTINLKIKANMALLRSLCKTLDPQYHSIVQEYLRFIKDNKQYFIPATTADKKWFWILTHHLYYVYKIYYQVRYGKRYSRGKR